MGDAAFGMVGMDVETAVREKIGVLTILLNNSVMGGYDRSMPIATARYATGRLTGDYTAVATGLALLIECMTSLVTANPLLAEALERTALGARHRQNGAVIALDLARFVDLAEFRRQAGRLARAIKALPPQPGMEILLPGERGARAAEQRRRDGIPVPDAVLEELRHLMEEPA